MDEAPKSIYIESTIPSYATARESSNALNLIRHAMTRDFWENERHKYRLYVSQTVIDECSKGDPEAARRRLNLIDGIEIMVEPEGLRALTDTYQDLLDIPHRAAPDCIHLAYCVFHGIDFLLTWNCKHLGPLTREKARVYNSKHGLWTPLLVTPESIRNTGRRSDYEQ
jgi:predicted nucleic acid-binding protein